MIYYFNITHMPRSNRTPWDRIRSTEKVWINHFLTKNFLYHTQSIVARQAISDRIVFLTICSCSIMNMSLLSMTDGIKLSARYWFSGLAIDSSFWEFSLWYFIVVILIFLSRQSVKKSCIFVISIFSLSCVGHLVDLGKNDRQPGPKTLNF